MRFELTITTEGAAFDDALRNLEVVNLSEKPPTALPMARRRETALTAAAIDVAALNLRTPKQTGAGPSFRSGRPLLSHSTTQPQRSTDE